jgi:hypothetical protein
MTELRVSTHGGWRGGFISREGAEKNLFSREDAKTRRREGAKKNGSLTKRHNPLPSPSVFEGEGKGGDVVAKMTSLRASTHGG